MGNVFEPDGVANFRGQGDPLTSNSFFHTYNTANFVALQMPLTRTSAYASATFDLTDDLELYAEGIYADYTVNTQIAPAPLQDVVMPASNPFIPPDLKRLLDSRAQTRTRRLTFRQAIDRERTARAVRTTTTCIS